MQLAKWHDQDGTLHPVVVADGETTGPETRIPANAR